jgi:hypothetical protein
LPHALDSDDDHNLFEGMYVRVVVPSLSQTDPLQGVHCLVAVRGDEEMDTDSTRTIRVCAKGSGVVEHADLRPQNLFTPAAYVCRVPAPYVLSPSKGGGVAASQNRDIADDGSSPIHAHVAHGS